MRTRPSLLQNVHRARFSRVLRSAVTREGAYLASAAAVVPLLVAAAVAFWHSPLSPAALDRPAALVAEGDVAGAAAAYDALAHSRASVETRREAAWRAAQLAALAALDGGDPQQAVTRLQAFLDTGDDAAHSADAWALMAGLYATELSSPSQAAAAWERAASLDSRHPDAGRWLLEAGKTWARTSQADASERALALATAYPSQSGSAWLALARLRLSTDPAAAYDAYDSAFRAVQDDSAGAALARLGMATALERLEGREAALAQLDEALAEGDLLDRSLMRRRQRLRGNL